MWFYKTYSVGAKHIGDLVGDDQLHHVLKKDTGAQILVDILTVFIIVVVIWWGIGEHILYL